MFFQGFAIKTLTGSHVMDYLSVSPMLVNPWWSGNHVVKNVHGNIVVHSEVHHNAGMSLLRNQLDS